MIACVLIPNFAVAIERRDNLSLANTPLILHRSGKVYAASPEVLENGAQVGMPVLKARTLLPAAQLAPAELSHYRYAFGQLLKTLCTFTPLVAPENEHWQFAINKRPAKTDPLAPADDPLSAVCYLDLESLPQAEAAEVAHNILLDVKEQLGLVCSVGVAKGKFPARIAAASGNPGSVTIITPGDEPKFLAPLPVSTLPLDAEIARRFRLLGVHTLGELAGLPDAAMLTQLGKNGALLHDPADSRDSHPILPYKPGAVARTTRQLDGPVTERPVLHESLKGIAAELASRLQTESYLARSLELVLVLEDGSHYERTLTLRQPISSPNPIARTLSQMAAQAPLRRGIISIEVNLFDLLPAVGRQLELFSHQSGKETRLRAALDDAVTRYGTACYYWIVLADRKLRPLKRRTKRTRLSEPPEDS
jgi:DNA polymerase-4